MCKFLEYGDNRVWSLDKVEAWVIRDKETGNILNPAGKFVFNSEDNALKSFYRALGGKANAVQFLDQVEIVKIGESY